MECDFCSKEEPAMWIYGRGGSIMLNVDKPLDVPPDPKSVGVVNIEKGEVAVCSECLPMVKAKDDKGLLQRAIVRLNIGPAHFDLIRVFQEALLSSLTGEERYDTLGTR